MVKTLILFIIVFTSSHSSLYSCDKIYLSFDSKSRIEAKSAQQILKNKSSSNKSIELIDRASFQSTYGDVHNYASGSTILNLIDDTDFTGSDVYVEVYRVNDHGEVILMGSSMKGAMFGKVNKMVDLAMRGLDFTCGQQNSR